MLYGSKLTNQAEAVLAPQVGRRKFLSILGITSLLSFLGIRRSEAAANPILERLPKDWLRLHGRIVYDYAVFLERCNLKHLDTIEIIKPHMNKRGSIQNTIPAPSMWRNIVPTLRVADKLAGFLSCGVKDVVSVYRSPSYNRLVGGRTESYHMRNNALDIVYNCSPYHAARVARKMREKGYFRGGVGDYPSFVHIDTRGTNVDW